MSNRKIATSVGILFFVQMITFAIGSSLIQSFIDSGASKTLLTIGVLFEMSSGLAVVAIGLLMYRVLKLVNKKLAVWYPVLRVIEFTVSAICGIYLLDRLKLVPHYQLLIYIPTGIGGLILSYLLYVSNLVPRFIAVLGLVGYALLLIAVPIDYSTSLDVSKGVGMLFFLPGGLFEFIALPIYLLAKGFKSTELKTSQA